MYIVQCLIGKAQHLAGDVVDKLNHYQNEEEFFKALRPIFVSPAHQTRARAEYTERTQKPNETLIDYFRGLAALCSDAFPPEDYPTENNRIDHAIAGIRNKSLRKALVQHRPASYEDCLNKAIHYAAQEHIIEMQEERIKASNKRLPQPIPIGLTGDPSTIQTHHRGWNTSVSNNTVVPMDIGYMRPAKGQVFFCTYHRTDKHSNVD